MLQVLQVLQAVLAVLALLVEPWAQVQAPMGHQAGMQSPLQVLQAQGRQLPWA